MRALLGILVFLGACQPHAALRDSSLPRGRVIEHHFFSAALGVDKRMRIYLPAGYDEGSRRYPAVYLLHGIGGDESDWVDKGHLDEAADEIGLEALVVMPDGDASFYINRMTPVEPDEYERCLREGHTFRHESPRTFCVKTPHYEDYIAHDLIDEIDGAFRTIPERDARAIDGLSMGGFGAFMLAMRHPNRFSQAASHSGVVALLYAGPHPYRSGEVQLVDDVSRWGAQVEPIGHWVRSLFGPDLAGWRTYDPSVLAASLTDGQLALFFDCGTDDRYKLDDEASYLHEVLKRAGIRHEFELTRGRHDFSLWRTRIRESLRFFASHWAHDPGHNAAQ